MKRCMAKRARIEAGQRETSTVFKRKRKSEVQGSSYTCPPRLQEGAKGLPLGDCCRATRTLDVQLEAEGQQAPMVANSLF